MEEECRKIENLTAQYDNLNFHKNVKEMTRLGRKRRQGVIKDEAGSILIDLPTKLKR